VKDHERKVQRVEKVFNNEVQKLLDRLKKELTRDLAGSEIDQTTRTDWQWARLRQFLSEANKKIDSSYGEISDYMHDGIKGLVEAGSDGLVSRINDAAGKRQLLPVNWTDETLNRIAGDTLVNGSTASEWWARQSQDFQDGVGDQLRIGLMKGETVPELTRRVFPSMPDIIEAQKAGEPARDIVRTAKRNAEAIVRTSTLTTMREANMDVYKANADVVKGVQWCATLDDRTTDICQKLDGKVWLLPDYEPDGHDEPFPGTSAHWNCRSAILPELKSWEELAEEAGGDTEWAKKMDEFQEGADGGAQRASRDGTLDAAVTYEEWLEGKTGGTDNGSGLPDETPTPNPPPEPETVAEPEPIVATEPEPKAQPPEPLDEREKDRAARAERIKAHEAEAKRLEEKASKLDEKARLLSEKAAAAREKWLETNPSDVNVVFGLMPKEVKKAQEQAEKAQKSAANAWNKANAPKLMAMSESALQEVLDATGIKFTAPLEAKKMGDAWAYYTQMSYNGEVLPGSKKIVMSTHEKYMNRLLSKTDHEALHDGGGFYVDKKTLEIVYMPPRERLKMLLTHELTHDGHMSHKSDFHEAMHGFLEKVFPSIKDYYYVWDPVGAEGRDYARWKNKPGLITKPDYEKMKAEKKQ